MKTTLMVLLVPGKARTITQQSTLCHSALSMFADVRLITGRPDSSVNIQDISEFCLEGVFCSAIIVESGWLSLLYFICEQRWHLTLNLGEYSKEIGCCSRNTNTDAPCQLMSSP